MYSRQKIYSMIFFLFSDKERAYLIVKAVVRLSDPAAMDLVLRKRIAFNIYKRHSITDKIRRKMGHTSSLTSLGVFYEVVSNIPKVVFSLIFLFFRSTDVMRYLCNQFSSLCFTILDIRFGKGKNVHFQIYP